MTDTPDLNALASRYLDLWQDQMNRMANDPATADMMTRTFSLMTKSAQAFAAADAASRDQAASPTGADKGSAPQQGASPSDDPQPATKTDSGSTAPVPNGGDAGTGQPDGAASPAALSGDGGVDVSGLVERIATLEARVALLEARLASSSDSADTAELGPAAAPG